MPTSNEKGDRGSGPVEDAVSSPNDDSWILKQEGLIRRAVHFCYLEYIVHGILRKKRTAQTDDGRHIELDASRESPSVDERTGHPYINNTIRSSRYTIWSFFPHQIWFQFSKAANFYFLITGILQLIPGLSTTGTYTTILPLLFFLCFSMGREGWDDYRRYRGDRAENRQKARVLYGFRAGGLEGFKKYSLGRVGIKIWSALRLERWSRVKEVVIEAIAVRANDKVSSKDGECSDSQSNPWVIVKWVDLNVGDIIELQRDDQVPADIVLLHVEGRNGIAYIETMALDGETNLKSRQPLAILSKACKTLQDLSRCRAKFSIEDPNLDLYDFNGKVTIGGETMPLTLTNVVYRGSTLRNTTRVVGIIVNTGEDCKIRMNANRNPQTKAPILQGETNKVVVILTLFVLFLAAGCTAGYEIWAKVFESKAWYLENSHLPLEDVLIAFIIEFNNLIPLALYVSLEIVKFGQFLLIQDVEMYDPISNTPMVSNTQTIYENLGQINYIFSDKTGTLTDNIMRFRRMSMGGRVWIHNIGAHPKIPGIVESFQSKDKTMDEKPKEISHSLAMNVGESTHIISSQKRCDAPSRQPDSLPPANTKLEKSEPGTNELEGYIRSNPDSSFARQAQQFILSMAVCHTCFPEVHSDGEIDFQAASPDELALVKAAQELGLVLVDRTAHSITLVNYYSISGAPVSETYEILDVIEFSTNRKRMSIVIKFPDGKICLYCKGADSVLQQRLASSSVAKRSQIGGLKNAVPGVHESLQDPFEHSPISRDHDSASKNDYFVGLTSAQLEGGGSLDSCFEHVNEFAEEGLRTLVYGYRFLSEKEYSSWKMVYHNARTSLVRRQELIEAAGEIIEHDLELAGATAIEDRLQAGVPETIEKLRRAGIKVWMLTGDKRETAINIAHSARIFKSDSQIIILDYGKGEVEDQLACAFRDVSSGRIKHATVVIDGQTLAGINCDESMVSMLYQLLLHSDSVICCRASPSQKAAMIKNIRQKIRGSITLAIGDGGNDIAMLQEAHVGVGISGKEGLQAARVADYSIAQFRFLQRLLFVHGHWNYIRTAKFILLTFWKEMLFYSIQVMYQRWNGYTGTSLFENWSLSVWNTLFTSLPVIIPGIFEQDLSAATLLAVPELYRYGQASKGFNMRKYAWWMLMAGIESQIIYFMIFGIYGMSYSTRDPSLFALGDLAFSTCVVFINFKLLILQYHHKTWIPFVSAFITIFGWWAWNLFISAIYSPSPAPYAVFHGFSERFGKDPIWWGVLVVVLAVVVVLELVADTVQRLLWPSMIERWQELEKDESVRTALEQRGGEGGYGLGHSPPPFDHVS